MIRFQLAFTRLWGKCQPYREEVFLSLIFLIAAFGFNIYRIQGDGWVYFAFLEKALGIPDPESSDIHLKWGYVQMGAAFFNMPFYLLAYTVERLTGWNIPVSGITLRSISINLASNFYVLSAIVLVVRTLKKLNYRSIYISVIAVLFSTSAFAAAAIMPSCSHAVELFLVSASVYYTIVYVEHSPSKWIVTGVLLALIVFVRYFNIVLIACAVMYFIMRKDWERLKFVVLGFVSVIWLLPLLFYTYNGGWFNLMGHTDDHKSISLFLTTVPLFPVNSFKLLVHPLHGILIWSPVVILSLLGLCLYPVTNNLKFLLLSMFTSILILYGFLPEWHAGWSFSNRYLTGLFPVYVIGLASFLQHSGFKAKLAVSVMTLYSVFLFFNWYLTVIHGDWGTPLDMVTAWVNGESPQFLGNELNSSIFLKRLSDACRYKYILKLM